MKYFLVAGEASGDLHGSRLMHAIKQIDKDAEFCFLGGDKMALEGGAPIVHFRDMAFMGFINVIINLGKIIRLRKIAEQTILDFEPDKVILIDYPGFNLRFAKFVKRNLPNTQINYYIAPKLWAWKSYRIRSIKKYVDRMYTIFPFETRFFSTYNYNVNYVGNPSVDSVEDFLRNEDWNKIEFCTQNGLDGRPIIALLAGSRIQEIKSCLPLMIKLIDKFPQFQFVVAAAPAVDISVYNNIVKNKAKILYASTYKILALSTAAVVNSGTATLETALMRVPEVVVYKVFGGRFTMMLKDFLIKTQWVSLVNIIAGKEVVKELLAHRFTVENTSIELEAILNNKEYNNKILLGYQEVINALGAPGAPEKCAKLIFEG